MYGAFVVLWVFRSSCSERIGDRMSVWQYIVTSDWSAVIAVDKYLAVQCHNILIALWETSGKWEHEVNGQYTCNETAQLHSFSAVCDIAHRRKKLLNVDIVVREW